MSELLGLALESIAADEGKNSFSSATFEITRRLCAEYGEADIAERIAVDASRAVPWRRLADLLGILQWDTRDNGSAIRRTAEHWLRDAADERLVLVALNLEAYPFADPAEMDRVLTNVAKKHPIAASRCWELINSRRHIKE